MFSTEDTIVAIATPPGRGGIGVVRISGPAAQHVASDLLKINQALQPRHATFARTEDDQVVATYFPAPHSYTGEDVIEISAHGNPVVLRRILDRGLEAGARLAEPGEFTLRAFLHERIDLVQAEAVADLIDAVTPLQARAAFDQLEGTLTTRIAEIDQKLFDLIARVEASLDFPDEGYHFVAAGEAAEALESITSRLTALLCDARRGRLIREGARVAIVGKPNVGKSSLFNALLGAGRSIVTAVPGTTRDIVTDTVDLDGLQIELIDTAGIRDAADEIEAEGVARARQAWATADLALLVFDASRPLDTEDIELLRQTDSMRRIIALNKSDLPASDEYSRIAVVSPMRDVSAATGNGVVQLGRTIRETLEGLPESVRREVAAVTNLRHVELLQRAHAAIERARTSIDSDAGPVPEEFVLADLQDARMALEEVTGKRSSEDLLRHIFSRFCIGK